MKPERVDPRDKTTPRIRGTTPGVEHAAWKLRRRLTPAEERLWKALTGRKLGGLEFRCQHPVGWFVLDFYCPRCKLVIEVDRSIHDQDEQAAHDRLRAEQLVAYGYRLLRFRNEVVFQNLPAVLRTILKAATADTQPPERTEPLPQRSPR